MRPLPEVPVTDALPALAAHLAAGRNAVLVVPTPDSPERREQSTLVPLALLPPLRQGSPGTSPDLYPFGATL